MDLLEDGDPLNNALDNIQSDRLKIREEGLRELKHILNQSRRSHAHTKELKSRTIHAALEKLFQVVSSERSAFVRATKANVKSASANRLTSCASAIRLMVEIFVTSMRLKAVLAALGHITQSLPTADGGFCAPLALEFFKTLHVILGHQPHVEHLDRAAWFDLVEFCISGIGIYAEEDETAMPVVSNGRISDPASMLHASSPAIGKRQSRGSIDHVVELVFCLRSLTFASNCPLLEKAEVILRTAVTFIRDGSSTTAAHSAAFETINACLKVLSTESNKLMAWAITEVLPLIQHLWPRKSPSLRDEMLVTMIHTKPYLTALGKQDQSETLLSVVESLLDTISAEYFEMREREHLSLDQLSLFTRDNPSMQTMPMQCSTFALRKSTRESEYSWTILYFLAFMTNWVDKQQSMHERQSPVNGERSPKRRRISSRFYNLATFAGAPSNGQKLTYSLQVIAFAVDQRSLTQTEWATLSDCLIRNASHESGDVSSWALITVASCALQPYYEFSMSHGPWLTIWHIAARLISSSSHSRAACHVLDALLCTGRVKFDEVAGSVDSLVSSASVYGPAILSDSALSLWSTLSDLWLARNPAQPVGLAYESMIEWLCGSWKPSDFENRSYSYQLSRDTTVTSFANACAEILGQNLYLKGRTWMSGLKLLGQAWSFQHLQQPLVDFLLLESSEEQSSRSSHRGKNIPDSNMASQTKTSTVLLRFLSSETGKTHKAWHEAVTSRSSTINEDMVHVLFSFCILGALVSSNLQPAYGDRATSLHMSLTSLAKDVISYVTEGNEVGKIHVLLETIAPIFPKISNGVDFHELFISAKPLSAILSYLAQALELHGNSLDTSLSEDGLDLDEQEFGGESKRDEKYEISRHQDTACTNERSFLDSTAGYVQFLSFLSRQIPRGDEPNEIPTAFLQYITSLSPEKLISTRPLIGMIMLSNFTMQVQDVGVLLGHLYKTILDPYAWNRCEVALGLCMDVMNGTATLWTNSSLVEIADFGAQLYEWFMETALENGILSIKSQVALTDLLYTLLDVEPGYAEHESKPSVRTRLFQLLKDGNLFVQHHISQHLVKVFNSFVLTQHELIFNDIFESLPNDLGHQEGIFVRMLVLTQIGCVWKSLLRRCVYHILETSGLLPESTHHARHCVQILTSEVEVVDAKSLFRLFSPQLLHTWLESHPLKNIPYTIFEYADLKSMLEDAPSQFLSQLLMIGAAENLGDFENELSLPIKDVLEKSFGQAAAYGIAKDLSMHGPGAAQSHAVEMQIRDLLGKHRYLELLARELPAIVGHLFVRLDQEEFIGKAFGKRPEYKYAADILGSIKSLGDSDVALSQTQQPSFKSKLLLDEIERICRRINKKSVEIWTAPLVLRVARMLFEDANEVFGPLHASRTIHRLRILVSLSGTTATTGYTLEMLIHALRPFVTNKQCSDDAIGLFRYLMEFGRDHLVRNPRFFVGTILTLMLELRDFLNSSQDSTTQGSRHRASISKAQDFRIWLGQYAESYDSASIPSESLQKLRGLVFSAQQISGASGASIETHESKLLLHILDDIKSNGELLGENFAFRCMNLLCRDFSAPLSFREDVLGADETAAHYAVAIWKTLGVHNASQQYFHWAANALGRSYGYAGLVAPEIIQETNLKALVGDQSHMFASNTATSGTAMIQFAVDTLWDDRPEIVGLAEAALRQIISRYGAADQASIIDQAIPNDIINHFAADFFGLEDPKLAEHSDLLQRFAETEKPFDNWIKDLTITIASNSSRESILKSIIPLLHAVTGCAQKLLPFVLHVSLLASAFSTVGSKQREQISLGFNTCFRNQTNKSQPHIKSLLNAVLYLRAQPLPQEHTILDRNEWLELDFLSMASAAYHCKMFKSALLFIEVDQSMAGRSPRKTSATTAVTSRSLPIDTLVSIFRELDEPDSFYGVEQASDLDSIATRLDYEGENIQSLLLRGAKMDSQLRGYGVDHVKHTAAIIQSLGKLGLNSVTTSLASTQHQAGVSSAAMETMIHSAMKLRQWDITVPPAALTTEGLVYRTFQSIYKFKDLDGTRRVVKNGLFDTIKGMKDVGWAGSMIPSSFRALSALTEVDDLLASQGRDQLFDTWQKLVARDTWIGNSRPGDVSLLLTSRETFCGILSHDARLQDSLRVSAKDSRLLEVYADLHASTTYRNLGSLQESLSSITYLSSLLGQSADELGLNFDFSTRKETANILWQRGELGASIKTLRGIIDAPNPESDVVPVGATGLLADLAHRISYARLERPEDILANYLRPALKQLKGVRQGAEAGKVFHEYATYCHNQLENPDNIEELRRSDRFKRQRTAEVRDLKSAITASKTDKEKVVAKKEYANVKRWLEIDEQENQRLRDAREQFLRSGLEHYLRSLAASDEFDTNAIRFLAIWFGNSENPTANKSVKAFQARVPSKKFTPLMNQLGSRLQETGNEFQVILADIVLRICQDHPYHGMYHIFAGSKTTGGNDSQARSRHGAAIQIAKRLEKVGKTGATWTSVHRANELYNKMAKLRTEETKQGAKLTMRQFESSKAVEREVPTLNVPPITMTIAIRDDLNYGEVPTVTKFRSAITIPSGISAPKIVTAVASNGVLYRQLFKSGSDDLRQDAIMEQVFEQVTALLRNSKSTRQRNLRIRTYKVVPLDATTGAIEFVDPTMSLNDFLVDAHHKYNPRELKWKVCRDKMGDVAELDVAARLKEYRFITSRFSPVLRHFFFERFQDPDDWFERRLAYTRSTAAISILGHVLGLGDRHCQNILLDTETGEVVHIDLGVAFEAGRVLPKPETVPFRLTRDIVDGFGILKTEGVFRRCCEFTLEALRHNKDTILTLLNVLRYDPLYTWSISPLRAKRLQDEQESRMLEEKAGSMAVASRAASRRSSAAAQQGFDEEAQFLKEKQWVDEGGEADRALSTVEKKLATGLSVSAAVNELIQQATDDKNLAVLFHGWAPYA